MSDENGKEKAFVLAQPKSPDEIARDEVKATMPKVRRECSRDPRLKRHVGAKWLFNQLTDDSFMNVFGGDGFGKVFTTLRQLHRRYGHDEDTLSAWATKLEETGWLWIQRRWPNWCFGITSVCRQPELFAPDHVRIQARASAEMNKTATDGFALENDKTVSSGQNDRDSRLSKPPLAVSETATDGSTNRQSRFHVPPLAGSLPGERREDEPSVTVSLTATDGQTNRQSRFSPPATHGHYKESPRSNGALEANGGGAPAPHDEQEAEFKKWEVRLDDMRNSDLRKLDGLLKGQFQRTKSEADANLVKRKLVAVRVRLLGPAPENVPTSAPSPAASPARPGRADLTDAELLETARTAVECKWWGSVTEGQIAALLKAGDTIPPELAKRFPQLSPAAVVADGSAVSTTRGAAESPPSGPTKKATAPHDERGQTERMNDETVTHDTRRRPLLSGAKSRNSNSPAPATAAAVSATSGASGSPKGKGIVSTNAPRGDRRRARP